MYKKILTIALVIAALGTTAQEVKLSDNQLNINILPLTLSYERKIDDNKSFTVSGGLVPTAYYRAGTAENESFFFASPFFNASLRNYYARKNTKKNNLKNNSGNYIGLYYQHQLTPLGSASDASEQFARNQVTNVFSVGPVWGIERNYASGIHLGLSLGVGYTNGEYQNGGDVTITGEFELGFVLFSK